MKKELSLKTSLFLCLIFFLISLFNIYHHEMWSDELQVWLLAKDSTLASLWYNMRFEGHPVLWHLMVMVLTRITENAFSMALLHIVIASLSTFLVLRYSPFGILQKILLLAGYFFLYEYTVLSRNYGLEVFFILLTCTLLSFREKKFLLISLALFFLAQTHIFGLFFSGCFLGLIILLSPKEFLKSKNFLIGLSIILVGWALCILQIIPDPQYGVAKGWHLFPLSNIGKAVTTVFKSYVPIPDGDYHFWDSHFIGNKLVKSLLTVVFLIIVALRYRGIPKLLLFFWVCNIIFWCFFYIKHYGAIRHHGHVFLILIVTEWLYLKLRHPDPKISDKLFKVFFYLVLFIQAGVGLYAVCVDYKYPFSMSKATSDYIKTHNHLQNLPVVSDDEYTGSPISALLDRPVFYAPRNEFGTFILWNEQRFNKTAIPDVLSRAENLAKNKKTDVLIIFSNKDPKLLNSFNLAKIAAFDGAILKTENYYLYRLKYNSI